MYIASGQAYHLFVNFLQFEFEYVPYDYSIVILNLLTLQTCVSDWRKKKNIPFKFKAINRNLLLVLWENKWHQWTIHKRSVSRFNGRMPIVAKIQHKQKKQNYYRSTLSSIQINGFKCDLFGFYLWFQLTNVIELPFDFAKCQKGFEFCFVIENEHKALYNLINSRQDIDIHSNFECDVIWFNV